MPRIAVASHRSYNEGILMHRNSGFVWIAAGLVLASAPCLAEQRPVVVQPNKPVLIVPQNSLKKTPDSNVKIERDKNGIASKPVMTKQQQEQQALASGCASKGQLSASECQQAAKACAAGANPAGCMTGEENKLINADKNAAEQQHIQQGLETGCVGKGGLSASECQRAAKTCASEANPQSCMVGEENKLINADKNAAEQQRIQQGLEAGCASKGHLSASECQQAAKTCAAGPNPDGCMVGEENKQINADKKTAEQQQMQQSLEATCVSKGINASECQQAAKTCAAGLGPTECMVGEMIKLTIEDQKAVEAKAEALRAAARRLNEKKSQ